MISFRKSIGFWDFQCWTPAEIRKPWLKYLHGYCFVENTYFVAFDESLPMRRVDRESRQIHYYQWVPFMLMGQALLFVLPKAICFMFSNKNGQFPKIWWILVNFLIIFLNFILQCWPSSGTVPRIGKTRSRRQTMLGGRPRGGTGACSGDPNGTTGSDPLSARIEFGRGWRKWSVGRILTGSRNLFS